MATISLSSLKASTYDRLENNSVFYTSAEVVGSINDAIKVLNLFTGFITGTGTASSVATTSMYEVPSNIFLVTRVRYNGRELDPLRFSALCEGSPRWMTEVASADGPVSTYTPLGLQINKKVILHPAPDITGATIEFFGITEPALLVNDSDTINCSAEFADIIASFAAHDRMTKNGGVVARDAMLVYKAFLKRMESLKRYRAKVNPRLQLEYIRPAEVSQ